MRGKWLPAPLAAQADMEPKSLLLMFLPTFVLFDDPFRVLVEQVLQTYHLCPFLLSLTALESTPTPTVLQMLLTPPSSAMSVHSVRVLVPISFLPAKLVLGKALYEYVASGTDDEQSEHPNAAGSGVRALLFDG